MSTDDSQSGAGRREVAYRIFAAEYDDADFSYSESDEERAPNYVITPTGARTNRLFVVGVLTEVEAVSEDVLRARVVDPTGAFVLYAGQYQPDEQAFLEGADPPMFVAVTGKARTFQPEDSDRVFTSIRPESINEVDADTRDRWTVQATERTLARVDHATTALRSGLEGDALGNALERRGIDAGLAEGISLALDHYGTTPAYLAAVRRMALDAARVVAGERDEVRAIDLSPDEPGDLTLADLPGTASGDEPTSARSSPQETTTESVATESVTDTDINAEDDTDTGVDAEADTDIDADTDAGTDIGDFDAEEFELEEETREEIEAEYGTEFQSGSEVDEPGNADIETPEPETPDHEASEPGTPEPETPGEDELEREEAADADIEEPTDADIEEPTDADIEEPTDADIEEPADVESGDRTDTSAEPTAEEPAETTDDSGEPTDVAASVDDVEDLQETVVDVMGELDDGTGADREALIATVSDRYDVTAQQIEDAIQDALMDGQCYEPDETSLKPI